MDKKQISQEEFNIFFDKLSGIDAKVFEIVKKPHTDFLREIEQTNYKNTFLSLSAIRGHLNFLKTGIFDLCEMDNLYCVKVIYRSFIEHWLLLQYIYFRFMKEKSDEPGTDYLRFCKIDEELKYGTSLKQINQLSELENLGKSPWQILCDLKPEFKKYSKKYISEKVKQFEYKRIIKYIAENLYKDDKNNIAFIHNIIPVYSELSSFVHGGPSTLNIQTKSRFWEYKDIAEMVSLISHSTDVLLFSMYAKEINKKYFKIAMRITKQGFGLKN